MPLSARIVAGLLVLLLVGAACGEGNSTESTTETGSGEAAQGGTNAEAVRFGESLAQIRGHHQVALELYEAGDKKGALVH
ncbi:MAG: hypothetical protein ACRDKT_08680, partial [Actinomycetota bacterium]